VAAFAKPCYPCVSRFGGCGLPDQATQTNSRQAGLEKDDDAHRAILQGYAVRAGMLAGRGELLLFMDADGATRVSDLNKLEAGLSRALQRGKQHGSCCGLSIARMTNTWAVRACLRVLTFLGARHSGCQQSTYGGCGCPGPGLILLPFRWSIRMRLNGKQSSNHPDRKYPRRA
jgi:hypothetical protein